MCFLELVLPPPWAEEALSLPKEFACDKPDEYHYIAMNKLITKLEFNHNRLNKVNE